MVATGILDVISDTLENMRDGLGGSLIIISDTEVKVIVEEEYASKTIYAGGHPGELADEFKCYKENFNNGFMEVLIKLVSEMIEGILVVTSGSLGVKVLIEDQGVCAVYTAKTLEEAFAKAADFDPIKLSKKNPN